jgi:hypothetical protein
LNPATGAAHRPSLPLDSEVYRRVDITHDGFHLGFFMLRMLWPFPLTTLRSRGMQVEAVDTEAQETRPSRLQHFVCRPAGLLDGGPYGVAV